MQDTDADTLPDIGPVEEDEEDREIFGDPVDDDIAD
jgi:hypothetical protein